MSNPLLFNPYIGAVLSNDVYSQESAFVYGPIPEGVSRPEMPDEYKNIQPVTQYSDPYTGYFGRAYVNHDTKEVFYAHRGTDPVVGMELGKDLKNDIQIATGNTPDQFESARTFYDGFNKNFVYGAAYDNYTTGHSLGGSISNTFGATYKMPSMTFDAPGDDGLSNNPFISDGDKEYIKENSFNFVGPSNVVNSSGDFLGSVMRLDYPLERGFQASESDPIADVPGDGLGSFKAAESLMDFADYTVSSHGMNNFVNSFDLDGSLKYDGNFEQISSSAYGDLYDSGEINFATSSDSMNGELYNHFFGTNMYDEQSVSTLGTDSTYSLGADLNLSGDGYSGEYGMPGENSFSFGSNMGSSNGENGYESTNSSFSLGVDTNFSSGSSDNTMISGSLSEPSDTQINSSDTDWGDVGITDTENTQGFGFSNLSEESGFLASGNVGFSDLESSGSSDFPEGDGGSDSFSSGDTGEGAQLAI